MDAARIFLFLFTYILFVVASLGLLPDATGYHQDVWERCRNQWTMVRYFAEFFAFVAAVTFITALKTPAYAMFNRTRPLSFRLIFCGRVFMAPTSLLAATQAALIASVFLLLLIHGPVRSLASFPLRSICQLDLSMLTTTALISSIFVSLSFIPGRWSMTGALRFVPIFFGVMLGSQAVRASHFLLTTSDGRILFLFPAKGPPRHYATRLCLLGASWLCFSWQAVFLSISKSKAGTCL